MSSEFNPVITDCGIADYRSMLARQRELFAELVGRKRRGEPVEHEYLLLLEHNDVITCGRHANHANLLVSADRLGSMGIEVVEIERGGDITYHGPGQLVVYPIIDLSLHGLGVRDYVSLLEESVIRTIARWGVIGERIDGATGVWIGKGTPEERKICAIGVRCSRYITMHGLALNVNTDLSKFKLINPCGFIDKGVTSMQKEHGHVVDMTEVKNVFREQFLNLF
ncbi:MAG: lipoyl(octanoyl) transferase LipB [Muribaculaceae bacterium]|nr:lipoyl(octanoyl) transferase LipB [Muribaculaceae bacterium]